MNKLKIYLDTSVISHLYAEETPEKMADTLLLWEKLKSNKYEVYISTIVIDELERCHEPKKSFMLNELKQLNYKFIKRTKGIKHLAEEYIKRNVLTKKKSC